VVLDGTISELARLTAETAGFCRQHSLGEDVEYDLSLVLEELFVNTITHGGCAGVQAAAAVGFTLLPDGVGVEYADRGTPFDPTSAPAPDLAAPLADRSVNGLGIHLMRQIMRDIKYHRVDGWNHIHMRRPTSAEGR
jgi:anti-sigma regulatory factor (Ser/Thr protein kinase)